MKSNNKSWLPMRITLFWYGMLFQFLSQNYSLISFAANLLHCLYDIQGIKIAFFNERKPLLTNVEISKRGISKNYHSHLIRIVYAVRKTSRNNSHPCFKMEQLFLLYLTCFDLQFWSHWIVGHSDKYYAFTIMTEKGFVFAELRMCWNQKNSSSPVIAELFEQF